MLYVLYLTIALLSSTSYGAEEQKTQTKSTRKTISSSEQRPDDGTWKGILFFKNTTGLERETISGNATFDGVKAIDLTIHGTVPNAHKLTLNSLSLKGRGNFNTLTTDVFSVTGSVDLSNSTITQMEIAGSLIATDTKFTNLIVRATQVYLDNVTADTVFMLTNTLKTPRVFIKGDKSHVKAVYFLRAKDIHHVKKFIDGELTEEEFFNSGIGRTKGQVIKEAGIIEVIQSVGTVPNFVYISKEALDSTLKFNHKMG